MELGSFSALETGWVPIAGELLHAGSMNCFRCSIGVRYIKSQRPVPPARALVGFWTMAQKTFSVAQASGGMSQSTAPSGLTDRERAKAAGMIQVRPLHFFRPVV